MSRPLITDPEVQAAIAALPDEPEEPGDARWVYNLTKEQAYRAWPCDICDTRRDEHADQVEGKFPELDITDHEFKEW
ncbi:hypothetical protein SEA_PAULODIABOLI_314 [Microbacterium phage PauloDiaboli]|nr:hypothetical protein SEA_PAULODIABOLI_314 [Microbacterium phage PauloDiaboli]